jgi:hypothetical protein
VAQTIEPMPRFPWYAAVQQSPARMTLEDLVGLSIRLRQELARAHAAIHVRSGHVDRLTQQLFEVERAIADALPTDEQTSDPLPWF